MKIKIVNPQAESSMAIQYHDSQATTWGTLENELKSKGVLANNMTCIIKENKLQLSISEAQLPVGLGSAYPVPVDFTIFLSPSQVKSGYNFTRYSDSKVGEIKNKLNNLLDNLITEFEGVEDYLNYPECTIVEIKTQFNNIIDDITESTTINNVTDADLIEAAAIFSEDPDLTEARNL